MTHKAAAPVSRKQHMMNRRKSVAPPLAVAISASSVLVLTGFGALGALNAEVSSPTAQAVSAGTLVLALADNGQGFTDNVSDLAPGDIVNRYVALTNSGTLAGDTLTLEVSTTGDASLIDDGTLGVTTEAITLVISSCSEAWDPTAGTCGGTTDVLNTATTLGGFTSAISLGAGTFAPSATKNLQISLTLPDQDETTVNGVFPTNTVQGKSVAVTYTFAVLQRAATTTNQ